MERRASDWERDRTVAPVPLIKVCQALAAAVVRILLLLGVWRPCSSLAQTYSRFEIGAHAASLTLSDAVSGNDEKVGFGARVTYNASQFLAWDAEGDFFPSTSPYGPQRGGRAFMAVAGPKAGWRWRKVGLFLNARPGIVNFSNAARVKTGIDPNGKPFFFIFPGLHLTHLALDLGGTMEINTGQRTFVRIDVSEMLLRYSDRIYPTPGTHGGSITSPGVIGNSLLVTAGFSYRLGRLDSQSISVQTTRRWEIGAQYGVLSLGRAKVMDDRFFVPINLGDDQGFGGRVTYNFSRWLAMDSVINYFFTNPHVGDAQRGGKILQGTFGPKAGFRAQRFGVFAKVRPGFLSYGGVQDNGFPPFPTTRLTYFAVDFGGVLEYYPSRRTVLRFDLGHTSVFYHAAKFAGPPGPPFYGGFTDPGFRDNGMQFTSGFGWRF